MRALLVALLVVVASVAFAANPKVRGKPTGALPTAGASAADSVAGGTSGGPNIVFIRIDDLADFDPARFTTPQLDQLRDEGVQFTEFYAASVCGPFTVAFMTGLDQQRSAAVSPPGVGALHSSYRTLPTLLRGEGYTSLEAVGKFGASRSGSTDTESYTNGVIAAGIRRYWGSPQASPIFVGSPDDWASVEIATATTATPAAVVTLTEYLWADTVTECQARIAGAAEPFFIVCGLNAVHEHAHDPAGGPPYTEAAAACASVAPEDCLDEMVAWLDPAVGDIYDTAQARGNTITVAVSDNGGWSQRTSDRDVTSGGGTANPDGAKGSFNEAGINTDLWIAGTGVEVLGAVTDRVSVVDLFTTILDIAGLDSHTVVTDTEGNRRVEDGASLKERLYSTGACETPSVGCHYDTKRRYITASSWSGGDGPYSRVLIDKENPTCKLRCDFNSDCAYNAAGTNVPESFTLPDETTAAVAGTCFDNRVLYANRLRAKKSFFDTEAWCDFYAATDPQVYCEDFGSGITNIRTLLEEFGTAVGTGNDTTNTPPGNGFAMHLTQNKSQWAGQYGIGCTTGVCRMDTILYLSDTQPSGTGTAELPNLWDAAGSNAACQVDVNHTSGVLRVATNGGSAVAIDDWEDLDAQWLAVRIETEAAASCKVWVDAFVDDDDDSEFGVGGLAFAKTADGTPTQAGSWWTTGIDGTDHYVARIAISDDVTATAEP